MSVIRQYFSGMQKNFETMSNIEIVNDVLNSSLQYSLSVTKANIARQSSYKFYLRTLDARFCFKPM